MDFIGWLESQERSPLTEAAVSGYRVIFEDQEGDSQKKSRQLLEKRGYDPEKQKEIINSVRDSIPALKNRVRGGKFTLACVRMFVDGEIRDEDTINKLNQIVRKIGETEYEKYDKDLNGFHAEELISKYMPAIEKEKDEQVSRLSSVHFSGNSDYEVVLIPDFNASSEYHKYNEWCLTYKPEMFDTYTQKGMNSLYFLLKKGFESVPREQGDGHPFDEYGVSMIAVTIEPEGYLHTCTVRWNHDIPSGFDADHIMDAEKLSGIVGFNVFDKCKPSEKGIKYFYRMKNAQNMIDAGKPLKEIFDEVKSFINGLTLVKMNDKYNVINNGRLMLTKWLDYVGDFSDGFARVGLNDKWNFIDTEGKLLLNQWFDFAGDFSDGFAKVLLNDKWNFIDKNGKLLSDQLFDYALDFFEGFARVRINDKANFIDTDGKLLSNQWFDDVGYFSDGFALVQLNGKENFIDTNGKLVLNQWVDGCFDFQYGFAKVTLNGKVNFIDTNGRLLSNQWFDDGYSFLNGSAEVVKDGVNYKIDTRGNLTPLG